MHPILPALCTPPPPCRYCERAGCAGLHPLWWQQHRPISRHRRRVRRKKQQQQHRGYRARWEGEGGKEGGKEGVRFGRGMGRRRGERRAHSAIRCGTTLTWWRPPSTSPTVISTGFPVACSLALHFTYFLPFAPFSYRYGPPGMTSYTPLSFTHTLLPPSPYLQDVLHS